jgi:HAD superfamily hydrolase (TIGR01484 family)
MSDIRLLATDFDGTLSSPDAGDMAARFAFRQLVFRLRTTFNTRWAVITGRHVECLEDLAAELAFHGLCPDYLVMEDACIYRRRGSRYSSYWWWNFSIDRRRKRQLAAYRPRVQALLEETLVRYPDAQNLAERRVMDFWLRFQKEEDARTVERHLLAEFAAVRELFVFRWGMEVCLAPTAGTKGEAVARLAQELKLGPRQIVTVGDGQNDISMLDGGCATRPAAVANATPEVMETVRRAGGHVASRPCIHGVLETIRHFTGWRD